MKLDDPDVVPREYATERGLAARKAAYANAAGPNAPDAVFERIRVARPRQFLEVGCGQGELAERVQRELGAKVVAVDQSERMVELTRARGVDARLGDVQGVAFADASFDCAVAARMRYHVPDVERALDELARVLERGGTLIAVTNFGDHLAERRNHLGTPVSTFGTFRGEDARPLLEQRFSAVDAVDCSGTMTFADRSAALAYAGPWATLSGVELNLPELAEPLVGRRRPVIFVATK